MPLRRARKSIRQVFLAPDVAERTARYATAHILLMSQPVFAIGLGLSMLGTRKVIEHSPTFSVALEIAPVPVWASVFAVLGCVVAFTLRRSLPAAQGSTLALSVAYSVWAVLLGLGIARGGIGTGLIAYLALSTMASAASAACRKART